MFCTNCGKQISAITKFCTECGASVDASVIKRHEPVRDNKSSIRGFVAGFKDGMSDEGGDQIGSAKLAPFNGSKIYRAWVIFLFVLGSLAVITGLFGLIASISSGNGSIAISSLLWIGIGGTVAMKTFNALRGRLRSD